MPTEMFDELASQSGSQDHRTTHVVQGAPGARPEARTNFASPCLWEEVFNHEVRLEGPHNTQSLAVREVCQAMIDE